MPVSNTKRRVIITLDKSLDSALEAIIKVNWEKGRHLTKSQIITAALINFIELYKKEEN